MYGWVKTILEPITGWRNKSFWCPREFVGVPQSYKGDQECSLKSIVSSKLYCKYLLVECFIVYLGRYGHLGVEAPHLLYFLLG